MSAPAVAGGWPPGTFRSERVTDLFLAWHRRDPDTDWPDEPDMWDGRALCGDAETAIERQGPAYSLTPGVHFARVAAHLAAVQAFRRFRLEWLGYYLWSGSTGYSVSHERRQLRKLSATVKRCRVILAALRPLAIQEARDHERAARALRRALKGAQ